MQDSSPRAVQPARKTTPAKRTVIWATRAYRGSLGLYVGIAYESGVLTIAVRTSSGGAIWVPANTALTDAEARAWAATGFRRAR